MKLPFEGYFPITQLFGENPASYAKYSLKGHNGIDWGIPTGTPILAPHDGVIKEAYYDAVGYGWYVKIENAVEGSVLAHFLSFSVSIGQTIKKGDRIALSDNTGNSTGPHLHWGYYKFPRDRNNGYNGYIDQYGLIQSFLVQNGTMTVDKKVFSDLITKLDSQTVLIQSLNKKLADMDTEVLNKLSAQKAELLNKIEAVFKG